MSTLPIFLSAYDHHRLRELLATMRDHTNVSQLQEELERAIIVPAHAGVPSYVVTVGTHVTLQDLQTGEFRKVVLTIPGNNAFASESEVSVLDSLGIALLGCTQGAVVTFHAPDGTRRELKIHRVLQSSVAEAAARLAAT